MSEYLADFIEDQVTACERVGVDGEEAIDAGADSEGVATAGNEAAILFIEVTAIVDAAAFAQVAHQTDAMACEENFGLVSHQFVNQVGFACTFGGGDSDDAVLGEGVGGEDFESLSLETEGGADGEAVIEGLPQLPFFKGQCCLDGFVTGISAVVGDQVIDAFAVFR